MQSVHRNNDSRSCGAKTTASSYKVFVNNEPVSIDGDPNTHGAGKLKGSQSNVKVNNKVIIVVGDNSSRDNHKDGLGRFDHPNPKASGGSPDVFAG